MSTSQSIVLATKGGSMTQTVGLANLPAHTHPLTAPASTVNAFSPVQPGSGTAQLMSTCTAGLASSETFALPAGAVGVVGSGQSFPSIGPSLVMNYIIALEGVFPTQN